MASIAPVGLASSRVTGPALRPAVDCLLRIAGKVTRPITFAEASEATYASDPSLAYKVRGISWSKTDLAGRDAG